MKRIMAAVLVSLMLLGLTGCGGGKTDTPPANDPKTPAPAVSEQIPEGPDLALDFWSGDWYGWWFVNEATGEYKDIEYEVADCCAHIDVKADGTGRITIWDEVFDRTDPLSEVDVTFAEGTTEHGMLVSESGWFLDSTISRGDWIVDAEAVISEGGTELPLWITGTCVDPENEENTFTFDMYIRPWGVLWDDLIQEDEVWEPLLYSDWYCPLIQEGKSAPDVIG